MALEGFCIGSVHRTPVTRQCLPRKSFSARVFQATRMVSTCPNIAMGKDLSSRDRHDGCQGSRRRLSQCSTRQVYLYARAVKACFLLQEPSLSPVVVRLLLAKAIVRQRMCPTRTWLHKYNPTHNKGQSEPSTQLRVALVASCMWPHRNRMRA